MKIHYTYNHKAFTIENSNFAGFDLLHSVSHLKCILTTWFYVGVKVHQCNFRSSDDGLEPKLVYVVNDEEGEEGPSSTSEVQ